MALRLIETVLDTEQRGFVAELLAGQDIFDSWIEPLPDDRVVMKILVSADRAEAVLDLFQKRFSARPGFRLLLLPVAASLPRPEEPPPAPPAAATPEKPKGPARISREELYAEIMDTTRVSGVYLVTVVLSAIVAAIGILHDNVAVVIGAMVIAPLLGPNVALSLATTLADAPLARTALKASAIGVAVALALSVALGLLVPVDPHVHEIAMRTTVGMADVALALAAGSAGALAFTTGVPSTLVGVMVSVALLPPLVTFGLLAGAGYERLAFGALLLVVMNLVGVNLAGVATFVAQGIRPARWWEADRARRASAIALALWIGLLAALVFVIRLSAG